MTASNTAKPVAIFDFDGTLIKGDSLWPFLMSVAGLTHTMVTMVEAAINARMSLPEGKTASSAEYRSRVKAYLIEYILGGVDVSTLQPVFERMQRWRVWNKKIVDALKDHHAKGHHIIIASGGLDIYLRPLLKDIPYHTLICTKLEIDSDGILTGQMSSGNMVRQRKAEIVAKYLKQNGPFGESWGYGNPPHDLPMLELVNHKTLIKPAALNHLLATIA